MVLSVMDSKVEFDVTKKVLKRLLDNKPTSEIELFHLVANEVTFDEFKTILSKLEQGELVDQVFHVRGKGAKKKWEIT